MGHVRLVYAIAYDSDRMNAPTQLASTAASRSISGAALNRLPAIAIWLGASALAVFFALLVSDSTFVEGMVLPRGNDSFYHAHRILDALGSRGFYQFDDRLHAPDGTWIPWPWGYDYLLAKTTQLALWIVPSLDAMELISYAAVAWILVNAALFMAATSVLKMSLETRALAIVCFALSPLTQQLHSVGMIDHHYVEHTFVLLNVWLGLRWFDRPDSARRAAVLGIALGAASAFHNGLFILQLVPLAAVFLLWLRGSAPNPRALRAFAVALLVTTQIVLLPSEPYRSGMFEFGLLSWFHFWVAVCTAAAIRFMSWRPYSRARCAQLVGLSLLLAIPLATQLSTALGFLSAQYSILEGITETSSPYRMFMDTFGPRGTADWYSWLVLLAPILLLFYAYRSCRERSPRELYYAVAAVFGLVLLLDQFRLHYFGFFFLVTAPLLIVEQLRTRAGVAPRRRVRRDAGGHHARVSTAASRPVVRLLRPGRQSRTMRTRCRFSWSSRSSAPRIPASCSRPPTTAAQSSFTAIAASLRTTSSCDAKTTRTSTRSTDCSSSRRRKSSPSDPTSSTSSCGRAISVFSRTGSCTSCRASRLRRR